MTLTPMTDGREVVEDYRAPQLSLRAHPLSFLRDELTRRRMVTCAELTSIKDGRHVEVAGIILVRQKPGSAKGVLFMTIEDETGVAQGILWPDRFEAQRRTVMSAAMINMRSRLQKEGEVIHVICDHIVDHTSCWRQLAANPFPIAPAGAMVLPTPVCPTAGMPVGNQKLATITTYHSIMTQTQTRWYALKREIFGRKFYSCGSATVPFSYIAALGSKGWSFSLVAFFTC